MQSFDFLSRDLFDRFQTLPIGQSQALQTSPHHCAVGLRHRLTRRFRIIRNPPPHLPRCIPRREKWIQQGDQWLSLGGQLRNLFVIHLSSLLGEISSALLHQPQSCDIFQKADAVPKTNFVGQLRFRACGSHPRFHTLHPQ